ncbi:MAG: hypothetical protein AUJ72_03660 [Candidatus Omnitrophica bacterium CG1_02_46_14]|nr:MAG: hypothetical protein AUJ72_03660 [Candidatus Omnitrophica bacterium CG1_02_46_14]
MSYFKALFLLFFLSLFCSLAIAKESSSLIRLTLADSLRIGGAQNPAIVMADERVKQALERLNQARAPLFPQVSGGAAETRQTRNLSTVGLPSTANASPVVGPFNVFDARLKLTQTLFDVATIKRLEAAALGHQVSLAEENKVKNDTLAVVALLHIQAKRAESLFQYSKSALKLARDRFRLANTHFKIGTGSEMDLKNAKAALSDGRFRWRTAKTAALDSQLDLKAALGMVEGQKIEILDEKLFSRNVLPTRSDILKSSAVTPEVKLAEKRLRQSEANVTAEKAEYLPRVSGTADYGASGDQPSQSKATYAYGLEISWALFEGGQRSARVAESQSKSREIATNFKDISNQQGIKAIEAKESLKNSRNLLKAAADNLAARSRERELTENRLKNGTASQFEVIDARFEEAKTKDGVEEAVATYRTAEVNLSHALGHVEKMIVSASG